MPEWLLFWIELKLLVREERCEKREEQTKLVEDEIDLLNGAWPFA